MIAQEVASDILHHIKKNNLQSWTTPTELRKGIICLSTKEKYDSAYVISAGVRVLVKKGKLVRASAKRFEVIK